MGRIEVIVVRTISMIIVEVLVIGGIGIRNKTQVVAVMRVVDQVKQ